MADATKNGDCLENTTTVINKLMKQRNTKQGLELQIDGRLCRCTTMVVSLTKLVNCMNIKQITTDAHGLVSMDYQFD
jgi:hypothetical protein